MFNLYLYYTQKKSHHVNRLINGSRATCGEPMNVTQARTARARSDEEKVTK